MAVLNLPRVKQRAIKPLNIQVAQSFTIANPFAALSFAEYLNRHPYLPENSVVFGICDDGLPVLLDLQDPAPGSVLISSSHLEGVIHILQMALFSTLTRTNSGELSILVISRDPDNWQPFQKLAGRHRLEILPVYDRVSASAILHFSRILDQRTNGRSRGNLHLLIVDDIDYLNRLDFDALINFQWFAKEGAQYQMRTLAGIQAERVEENDRFLSSFRTRVIGYVSDPFHATWLANARPPDTTAFHPTEQFCVRINRSWMNFWLPGR